MLRQLRKPRRQEPPDAQHLQAARHDVISERMLSLSPRSAFQTTPPVFLHTAQRRPRPEHTRLGPLAVALAARHRSHKALTARASTL